MSDAAQASLQSSYPSRRTAWMSTAIIFILIMIAMADRIAISMLIKPIKQDFGIGDFYAGLLVGAAFAIFYMIALFPMGWAADRYSRKKVLFFCLATWTIASIACGFASGFIVLFMLRMLVGAGEAGVGPGGQGIIGASFPKDELAKPFAIYGIGFQVGAALGVAGAGYILAIADKGAFQGWPIIGEMAPWRIAFIMIGLPGILALLLIPLLHDPEDSQRQLRREENKASAPVAPLLPFLNENKALFTIVLVAIGLSAVGFGCVLGWVPEYLQREFGMSPQAAGATLGSTLLTSAILSQAIYSAIVDALAKRGMSDSALNVGLVPLLASVPVGALAMSSTTQSGFLTYLFILMCCLMPLNAMGSTIIQQLSPAQLRSRLSSIYILIVTLIGMAGGPAIVGWLSEFVFGEDRLGLAISSVMITALALSFIVFIFGRKMIKAHLD